MSVKKRGLGRGLDSLLGAKNEIDAVADVSTVEVTHTSETKADHSLAKQELQLLPIEQIHRGQYQPRRYFDQDALEDLANSIREKGLLQPIVVRQSGENRYEIIAGERRWRASQLAELDQMPAVVKSMDDETVMAVALIENIQREDLNPMEQALAMARLKDEFSLTHEEVAKAVGKSRSAVTNLIRLCGLSKALQAMLESGDLEMGHARALLPLDEDQQIIAAQEIIEQQLTVRQTESLVKRLQTDSPKKAKVTPAKSADVRRLEQNLSEKLGTAVVINQSRGGKGKLVIDFSSADILEGILNHIK